MNLKDLTIGWLPEAFRFAAAAFVFYFVQPKLPAGFPFVWDQVIAVGCAVVAYLLTAIVLQLIVGRPELTVVWDVNGHTVLTPTTTLTYSGTTRQLLAVGISFQGSSALALYVQRVSKKHVPCLCVRFSPMDYLYLSSARLPDGVTLLADGIQIDFAQGFRAGPLSKSQLMATERIIPMGSSPLTYHVNFPGDKNVRRIAWLTRVKKELDSFEIRK